MIDKGLLRQMECLNALNDGQLEKLAVVCEAQTYESYEYVAREDETAEALYIVLTGRVAIEIHLPMAQKVSVFIVRRGDLFGWSAAVSPHTVTASSICKDKTELIVIPKDALLDLMENDIALKASIMETIAQVIRSRLKDTRQQMSYFLGG